MNSLRDAKDIYNAIEVPQELSETVRVAARSAARGRAHSPRHAVRYAACVAAACLVLFVTVLNTVPTFAAGLSGIPVLGRLAQVLTFAEYERHGENETLIVRQPKLVNTGNTALEKRINLEIQRQIDALVQSFQAEAEEARRLYLENGGAEEDYMIPEININYRICCNNGSAVSFILVKSETHASYYEEQYYYNIDLETGRELTLRDLLGPNYRQTVREQVRRQIEQRVARNPEAYYYSEKELADFGMEIEDPGFYLNEKGNVVAVYPKYEIAPGYMGIQEFEITQ